MKATKSYNNLVSWYAWLERLAFGNLLTRVRTNVLEDLLEHLQTGQRVLILGEGDGRFLQDFSHKSRLACQVDCVDKSQAMLARASSRLAENTSLDVNFIHVDVTCGIASEGLYDAVVSLFFLDNFNAKTLEHLTCDISNRLRPGGRWYLADFRVGTKRLNNQLWLWLMYRFFRLTTDIEANTLVDPTQWLEAHLSLTKRRTWQRGFLVSETWQRSPQKPHQHATSKTP